MLMRTVRVMALSAAVLATVFANAADIPPPPKADWPLIQDVQAQTEATVKDAWEKQADCAGDVTVADVGGTKVWRLPCRFTAGKETRAAWDLKVNLDMTACTGLRFQFYCANSVPLANVSLYFHSGNGWYRTDLPVPEDGRWQAVTIEKAAADIEDSPAGWSQVSAIRFSPWRGSSEDTEIAIANIGLVGADAPIVIIRGDAGAAKGDGGERKSVAQFAGIVAAALKETSIPYAVLSDADVTPERLAGKRVAILPHNPGIPDSIVANLVQFMDAGGKVICFYGMPEAIAEKGGMKPGKYMPATAPGAFSTIRPTGTDLPGMPESVEQRSWNIVTAEPVEGRSRIAAVWYDAEGKPTPYPAIAVSDNLVYMSHVLLDDGWAGKRQMLLAMLAHFVPDVWQQAAQAELDAIGRIGAFASYDEASTALAATARTQPAIQPELDAALAARTQAQTLLASGNAVAAIPEAQKAQAALLRAWCRMPSPHTPEHRAFWCHSAFGVTGMDWDQAIKTLADNGFTAILPNMLWGGVAFYPSEVLPAYADLATRGDQIALCLAACRKYGVQCHVWKVNWNMGSATPDAFVQKMAADARTQVSFDGKREERWLCPSHPDNQQLEIDAMVELARKYDLDGIHFDYIRYPGPDNCFCDGCRDRFQKAIGQVVGSWPSDVRAGGALQQPWLQWRRDNITKVVAGVADKAREARPGIKISAAVFANYPVDRDGVAQDWKLWCEKGYLDFVCPMDYIESNTSFRRTVTRQVEWAGKVPCYPGIGLSCWPNRQDIVKLVEQIGITRELKTGGFTIFNYDAQSAPLLPLCGLGVTAKR
ncbi:MAG: hypothetical protein A3K19_26090 [Lentisphaerae bacterium RIFOXYB12_FULL_65_16]|nr:MAG: hypothetical protein A3K18_23040 [Lentisphaerae bacterium RIFOXYA12_64_32]OGV87739.1 MAG: hypothetical protein A3K19_26090 [Lentisphaerae bacterium RIFOXYB12_FULL_65_16]